MRSKSPELMSEIKKYIENYYLQNRQSPSTTKIAEAVGIARGTAYKYLVEMAEKNMIEYDGQEVSTNVTRKYSGEQTQTPIVGSIPCGSPQYEEENMEELLEILIEIDDSIDYENETALIDDQLLDSIAIITLVSELEDAVDISIEASEMMPVNFNSAKAIWAMVQRLQED